MDVDNDGDDDLLVAAPLWGNDITQEFFPGEVTKGLVDGETGRNLCEVVKGLGDGAIIILFI